MHRLTRISCMLHNIANLIETYMTVMLLASKLKLAKEGNKMTKFLTLIINVGVSYK